MRFAALAVLAALASGCGGSTAVHAPPVDWRLEATSLVDQLRSDEATAETAGSTRAAAAHSLRNLSELYGLLVAYSDLAGCRTMVAGTEAPMTFRQVLVRPCEHLQRASALFTRAASDHDPAALAAATRQAALADPQLVRALLLAKLR